MEAKEKYSRGENEGENSKALILGYLCKVLNHFMLMFSFMFL